MKLALRASTPLRRWLALLLLLNTLAAAPPPARAQATAAAPAKSAAAATLSAAEREAIERLKVETLREVTAALAADDMQGRGTAQAGGDRAARYIAERFTKLGLKPLGDNGTYLQAIKFRSTEVQPDSFVKAGDATLKLKDDFVPAPPLTSDLIEGSGGLVFAGYGATSPALKRNDLEGLDVKGKIVVLLGGRPKGADKAEWARAANPQMLVGTLMMRGATGVMLADVQFGNSGYTEIGEYLSRRSVSLADAPEPNLPFKLPPILLISDAGVEKLFAGTGATYAQTRARAEAGEHVSRELNKPASISVRVKREQGTGSNVVGYLEGSDPKLKEEAVVYSAHYDAWGVSADGRIFHGAADNALGVAEITAIAEAFSKAPRRPRRSVIFLAVTGEEHGLLGAEHWVKNPTWPVEKIAANLNYDGIGTEIYGPVKRVVAFGAEHSDLGALAESVVSALGGQVVPDPMPEEKAFYRSDHYAFVKRGVPALMLLGGPEGETQKWIARAREWMKKDYHQASDVVRPDWSWEGARGVAAIGLVAGLRIADAEQMPAWLATSRFNRKRGTNEPPPPEQ